MNTTALRDSRYISSIVPILSETPRNSIVNKDKNINTFDMNEISGRKYYFSVHSVVRILTLVHIQINM